ncbi:MAG: hypothetical protein HQL08_10375 [Nitrospirae bacterium]|nr:hypothetical protein [Nitrospirota bacterium]
MRIDTTLQNVPDIKGQTDQQANNRPDARDQAGNAAGGQAVKHASQQAGVAEASSNSLLVGGKGVIALDDNKNVVVRFMDDKGKIVAQYPPEEYLSMMKSLNQVAESLFHVKA